MSIDYETLALVHLKTKSLENNRESTGVITMKKQNEVPQGQTRILIVDDHPIFCEGLIQFLNQEADLTVCGQAEDVQSALEAIAALQPDLVIVDLSLKNSNGFELITEMKKRDRRLPLLVLSMHSELIYAERTLQAGAKGYITKQEVAETVVTAIRQVLEGEIYLSDQTKAKMLGQISDRHGTLIASLSNRELQVFQLIGQGYGASQIAETLDLSVKTVEAYQARIKGKLNLKDSTELAQYAIQWLQSENAI